MHSSPVLTTTVAIVGGGPAGLMAAQWLSGRGHQVMLFDAMPSVGRKFLQAGKGGMNLTHSEPYAAFISRYGEATPYLAPMLAEFGADALRAWARDLGFETFVGSSGRVFPTDMKAAPLLRRWLERLRAQGVTFHMRHECLGWNAQQQLRFATPDGEIGVAADATLLALGGASWPRLGSTGRWAGWLANEAVTMTPFAPSNCGFEMPWSTFFRERFAGHPLKTVCISVQQADGSLIQRQGECVITEHGMEGSLLYPFTPQLRRELTQHGRACFWLDLLPGRSLERVQQELHLPRGAKSLANHLRSRLGLEGVKAALLRECAQPAQMLDMNQLANLIKQLPITVTATRPIDEAISTAGGVCFTSLNAQLMLNSQPGVFCAGEMLDWEAPTGGYLLTGCFSSGLWAAKGIENWLDQSR